MFKRLRDKFSAEACKHPKINSFLKGTVWTLRALILLRILYIAYTISVMLIQTPPDQWSDLAWWSIIGEVMTLVVTFLITGVAI